MTATVAIAIPVRRDGRPPFGAGGSWRGLIEGVVNRIDMPMIREDAPTTILKRLFQNVCRFC
jgi:hypothetical protein